MSENWTRRVGARLGIRAITGVAGTAGALFMVFGRGGLFWLGVILLAFAVVLGFVDGYKALSEK